MNDIFDLFGTKKKSSKKKPAQTNIFNLFGQEKKSSKNKHSEMNNIYNLFGEKKSSRAKTAKQNNIFSMFGPEKKSSNISAPGVPKVYVNRVGDRNITPAEKEAYKKEKGYRCEECHHKFPDWQLHVHHKKGIASYKSPSGIDIPTYSFGEKIRQGYDKKRNLEVTCIPCHNKTKRKKKKNSKKVVNKGYLEINSL